MYDLEHESSVAWVHGSPQAFPLTINKDDNTGPENLVGKSVLVRIKEEEPAGPTLVGDMVTLTSADDDEIDLASANVGVILIKTTQEHSETWDLNDVVVFYVSVFNVDGSLFTKTSFRALLSL